MTLYPPAFREGFYPLFSDNNGGFPSSTYVLQAT